MKKFGIIGHLDRPQIKEVTRTIIKWAEKNGMECRICAELVQLVGRDDIASEKEEIWKHSDCIISLGGDGSMLTSARAAGCHQIPILGINLGSLGFLTEVTHDQLLQSLDKLKNDDFNIEERMVLEISLPVIGSTDLFALNDFVFDHGEATNLIQLDLYSNDLFVCSYDVDGVIISTPTGSTAYSLSVGGPIINPLMEAIMVSPISPHTLTLRPVIFPAGDILTVKVGGVDKKLRVSIDGRIAGELISGQEASVKKSDYKIKLIKFEAGSFYEVLRSKLHWGARPLLNT